MNILEKGQLIPGYLKTLGTKTSSLLLSKSKYISQILNSEDEEIIPYIKYIELFERFHLRSSEFFRKNLVSKENGSNPAFFKNLYISPLSHFTIKSIRPWEGENYKNSPEKTELKIEQNKAVLIENARVVTARLCQILEEEIKNQWSCQEYDPMVFAASVLKKIKDQNLPLSGVHLHMILEGLVHIEKMYMHFSNTLSGLLNTDVSSLGYAELQGAENLLDRHGDRNYLLWKQSGLDGIVLRILKNFSDKNNLVKFLQSSGVGLGSQNISHFEEILKNDSFDPYDSEILPFLETLLGTERKNSIFNTIAATMYFFHEITVSVDITISSPAIILKYDDPFGLNNNGEPDNKISSQYLFIDKNNEGGVSETVEYEWRRFLERNIFQEIWKKVVQNRLPLNPKNVLEGKEDLLLYDQGWEYIKTEIIAFLECDRELPLSNLDIYTGKQEDIKIDESVQKMALICILHSLQKIKACLRPQYTCKREQKNGHYIDVFDEVDFLEGLVPMIRTSESLEIAQKRIDMHYGDIYGIFDSIDLLDILRYVQKYEKEMEFINIADLSISIHELTGNIQVVNNFDENILLIDPKNASRSEILQKIQTIV